MQCNHSAVYRNATVFLNSASKQMMGRLYSLVNVFGLVMSYGFTEIAWSCLIGTAHANSILREVSAYTIFAIAMGIGRHVLLCTLVALHFAKQIGDLRAAYHEAQDLCEALQSTATASAVTLLPLLLSMITSPDAIIEAMGVTIAPHIVGAMLTLGPCIERR